MEVLAAVGLCVASALAYAVAAVLQRRVADRPAGRLWREPGWLAALALNGVGGLLHVVALRFAPLSLVQPFGVLTLALAVPISATLERRAVGRYEWHGIGLTVAGLGGLLLLVEPAEIGVLGGWQLVGLILAAAATVAVLGVRRTGLRTGAASGVAFGVSSALTQTATVLLSTGRPTVSPMLAVLAIGMFAGAGLVFAQLSYRDSLGAPLAVATLANPVAAAAIGVVLLGEQVVGGRLGVAMALISAVAAGLGVCVLTRAPDDLGSSGGEVFRRASGQPATPRARADRPDLAG